MKLYKNGKLEWDEKKQKWTKEIYPEQDVDGNFIKWKFGKKQRPTCAYCNKLLETRKENPYTRQTRYCSPDHQKRHATIVSRAKIKFKITENTKSWIVLMPLMFEWFFDKTGKLQNRKLRERIESRDVQVVINGKRFPYTTKKGKL